MKTTLDSKTAPSRSPRHGWLRGFLIALPLMMCVQAMQAQTHPANGAPVTPASTYPETSGSPAAAPPALTAVPSVDQSHYILSPGDVLEISVFNAPDLSQRAVVNSAGNIYMPLINDVHVAGLHVENAQGVVEQAYLKDGVLKVPHVSIVVTSYSSGVLLMGEVNRTGIYPIVGAGRLFDIFAEAGGTTPSAGQLVTITHKGSTTEPQTLFLTSDPVKSLEANVVVQQGDTIIVSKAGVLYVVGEVLAPSGFLMDEKGQYTVMKVVAMAHGLGKFAKPSKARIVRRTPEGEKEILVPLDKILVSKLPDVAMQANDILFIPPSKGKQAASRSIDVAVALASGVAYYGLSR
ncbi:polysaccharide biosynthesis/export family protein [Granulicella mallensis]|uniref:Polysaccharide export outer membrane protein n=1 Tax=Granulicella mallensis TaxID=940614 RepID=A0A7W7ZUQ2_9BACT|nr:polysaccharide biosynthesis/export family protein [Granulicella mallensis]MBB5066460.1 polysaccharide export outer membrane protein [Granulicella mallensis]